MKIEHLPKNTFLPKVGNIEVTLLFHFSKNKLRENCDCLVLAMETSKEEQKCVVR